MSRRSCGRAPSNHRTAVVWLAALPFLLLLFGCREYAPSGPAPEPATSRFGLPLKGWFEYDNWKLSPNGSRIPTSHFRNSWIVADTGAIGIGYSDVTIVIDSIFSEDLFGNDSLVRLEHRHLRTAPNGDVFEFGFVAGLLWVRDTLQISPKWDKLFSPSAGANSSWIVETNDSATTGTFYGRYLPALEIVETSINGMSTGVLSYRVEITGRNLALVLWISTSPSAFLRLWDQSEMLYNRMFRELRVIRIGG